MKHRFFAAACLTLLTLSASLPAADARPGGGHSFGSRGSRTYSAPPPTRTSPYGAQPMEQSLTPRGPYMGQPGGYGAPRYGYGTRHPFLTGFAGGLLGAGLFGLLSGHGFLGGMHSGLGILGFLLQVVLIGFVISWFLRRRRLSTAGLSPAMGGGALTITANDYRAFQRLLIDIQAAWSARNLRALSTMATPEMTAQFNDQLSELASRGARNIVSDVQFQQGDLSEAWREGNREYATVAMRFSMIDVTTDMTGRVIDGSSTERTLVTELWTFLRMEGTGNWVLSAIQQVR
jgi:predicted lipid-binding transport protein (Tim44 family)